MKVVYLGIAGVRMGRIKLDDLTHPVTRLADTFDSALAGQFTSFSWHALLTAKPDLRGLRRFIEFDPLLDYSALEPGSAATSSIRQAAADLKLESEFGARIRLTGPIALADEEFAT